MLQFKSPGNELLVTCQRALNGDCSFKNVQNARSILFEICLQMEHQNAENVREIDLVKLVENQSDDKS